MASSAVHILFVTVTLATGAASMADLAEVPFDLGHFLGETGVGRIDEIAWQMKPLFDALPKQGGSKRLDTESATYCLQRHLAEQRRWRVEALSSGQSAFGFGGIFNGLPTRSAPGRLSEILASGLSGGEGLGLREIAALAAAVEQSVRLEAKEMLSMALAIHSASGEQDLNDHTRDLVVQTFLLFYVLPDTDYSKQSPETIKKYISLAGRAYPAWSDTLKWARGLQSGSLEGRMEDIVFGYQNFFDDQCNGLQSLLLKHEQPGTGRVPLSKLRHANLPNSIFQFSDSLHELRSMGALDDSNAKRPAIIIPNYMTADLNCLPTSQIVATCCMSPCNALLASLEKAVGSPYASPSQISDWARASNVSAKLTEELEEIAVQASVSVSGFPIHGHALARWLHAAFPSQCPTPKEPAGWGAVAIATAEAWWQSARWMLRTLALVVAAASVVVGLLRSMRSQKQNKDKKVD